MKKLTPKQKKELEYLKNRSLLIIDYIIDKDSNPIILQMRETIKIAFEKNDLKGLKEISRDMNAWAKSLSTEDTKELEKLLAGRFREDLTGDQLTLTIIQEIIKKGEIRNEEEYRIMHEYLQDISEKDVFFDKRLKLEKLLKGYIEQEMKSE